MDKRFEHYKEQYYFELTRKGQLSSNMSIPIGFMTAIFTACAYFGLNIGSLISLWIIWIFLVLISVAIFFIIKASYHLFKAFVGLNYGYNPSPDKLYEFEKKHINDPQLEAKFFEGIKKSYINTTTRNRINNNSRANHLYKTNVNTIIAIAFIILSAIPFFIGKNINDYQNKSLTKKHIVMKLNEENNWSASENEDLPSDPSTSDFPTDEWITESLEIDVPTETTDSIPPQIESNNDSDTIEKGE